LAQHHQHCTLSVVRQRLPRGHSWLTGLAHGVTPASESAPEALRDRFSVIRRVLSNYKRQSVWGIEAAFKNLKDDLRLRPIHHQLEHRIEAHIFVAFLAYCLQVTLRARLKPLASGLTARAILDKFAAVQMLDVHFPTTDGRTLILTRHTELNADRKLLVKQLKLDLPPQPPPRITAGDQFLRAPAIAPV
jgi:hypothetical protein